MPPKAKITKEMVMEAAFDIARTEGAEQINARSVSQKLGCSTQPIMYHFSKIEDLKRTTYEKTDKFHSEYLMNGLEQSEDFMLSIGLNYIRFAIKEPNLFRFLFQSGYVVENNLLEMLDSIELSPILAEMQDISGLNEKQMKEVFITIALFVHGYASFFANNSLEYNESIVSEHLKRVYLGALLALKEE